MPSTNETQPLSLSEESISIDLFISWWVDGVNNEWHLFIRWWEELEAWFFDTQIGEIRWKLFKLVVFEWDSIDPNLDGVVSKEGDLMMIIASKNEIEEMLEEYKNVLVIWLHPNTQARFAA